MKFERLQFRPLYLSILRLHFCILCNRGKRNSLFKYPAIPFPNQIRRIIYVSKDLNRQTDYSFANQRCYVFIGIGWGAMLAVDAACAILALESPVFCRINAFPLGSIYLCSFVCRQRSMQSYSTACYPCPKSRSNRKISERATSKGFFHFQSVFRLESQFKHHAIPFPFKYRAGTASGLSSMSFCFLAIRRSLVIINGCLWRVTEFECFVIFLFRTCKLHQWQKIVFEAL